MRYGPLDTENNRAVGKSRKRSASGCSSSRRDRVPMFTKMDDEQLRTLIARVIMAFYRRVYQDPWLKVVFQGSPREHLESQQTNFMLAAFGGPKTYRGRSPSDAHPHIFIDESMWQRRETTLREAFAETRFPEEMQLKWLRIDEAFKKSIVKHFAADCRKRYYTDAIIAVPDPLAGEDVPNALGADGS